MKTGIELIAEERARQVSEEGWTAEHDDAHTGHQLATAAAFYAAPGNLPGIPTGVAPRSRLWLWWPFSREWRKESPKDRVRELVKAGALVAAEIDRLQRAAEKNG